MNYSLCLQATYKHVDIALCNDDNIIQSLTILNHNSSAQLIPCIDQLLKKHSLSLKDCSYIAANQGPAPFTTLRSVLSTINGIYEATRIPLIGIDGLQGLIARHTSKNYTYTIALLNAFNNELYYALYSNDITITGYASMEETIDLIQKTINHNSALVIGNGIEIVKKHIPCFFDNTALFTNPSIEYTTIADIAHLAWSSWNTHTNFNAPLMPLYLKKHAAERI